MLWINTVKKAKRRALFDAPSPGAVFDLARRWYDNIDKVYGGSAGRCCAVLNLRTRSTSGGLADSMWQKYPIGEDLKVNDPETNAPARKNLDLRVPPDKDAVGYGSIEGLQKRGAVVIAGIFGAAEAQNAGCAFIPA
jgi:hypothetical protein